MISTALLLLPLGCDDDVRTYQDEGRVCVSAESIGTFDSGDSLTLTYTADECISACPRFEEAACDAEVVGDRIVVHSDASWAPSDEICITLCAALQAECTIDGLAPGTYQVEHGEDAVTLTLPSEVEREVCTTQ